MVDQQFATRFAAEWINCWNKQDLDTLMTHYTEDFSIQTPYALKIYPDCCGVISGKSNVRLYWATALSKLPNLHFKLLEVLIGVNSISIYYHNADSGKNAVENLFFNADGLVTQVIVMYN